MTIERKVVVGLDDIKAITLECECGGEQPKSLAMTPRSAK